MIWKVLGIEKTKDKEEIRKAYLNKLHDVNPEDDAEGFKELRSAYEEAMRLADTDDDVKDDGDEKKHQKKNDVDRWIDQFDAVYCDMSLRRDEKCWNKILNDPICDDLDTEIEAGEKLLVFLMSHAYLPKKIWQAIDKRFNYSDNIASLAERFPENFLHYVLWQMKNPGFIDYDLFDGDMKDHPDEFINKLYEIKGAEETKDFAKAEKLIKEIERFGITHPYVEVEKANCLLLKCKDLDEFSKKDEGSIEDKIDIKDSEDKKSEEEEKELRAEALDIMEELDFEYSSNVYIHRIYAEALVANRKVEAARKIFDELEELDKGSKYSAMFGRAKCLILAGDYENAKEELEDILEDKVQDMEALALLDVVNVTLVDDYLEKIKDDKDLDIVVKLGWCYYQQREFKKGILLLDDFGDSDEYDFVNLRCRLYLADEEYRKAYPWSQKWLAMIEESVDDGSRTMTKRKKRHSLALFSIGVCMWELYLDSKEKLTEDNNVYDDKWLLNATDYIEKASQEEENGLVKMSYMEQLAKFYLADKQYEECVRVCTDIIDIDSGFFPAYVHRQRANYELKNAREVVDDYYECVEIYPEYAPPYVLAAEVFFAFEQYDDIERVLKKADSSDLKSDALELYRIRVLHYKEFSSDNLKKCLSMIERLIDDIREKEKNRNKENVDKDNNLKGDIVLLDQSRVSDIEKPDDLAREHALIYWDMDENEKAISVIDDFLKDNNDNFSLRNLKVDILNQMGKNDDALKLCKKLYKQFPTVYVQTRLGTCYERVGDYKNARKMYEEAYNKDPKYNPVVRRLMYLYSYLSDKEKNLEHCRTGIRYATEYIELTDAAEGYVERGNLYIDIYELEKAVNDCKKAIEINENAYYAYNNLGCALLKLRKTKDAIPPLLQAVKIDERKDHLPYLNLAEAYTVLGRYDDAIVEYEKLLSLFPKHTYVWKDIMKLYCRQGKYDKAIQYWEKEINAIQKKLNKCSVFDRINMTKQSDMTHLEEKLLEYYCELGDVCRQAGMFVQSNECYEKVYKRWNNYLKFNLSAKAAFKLIDYYRDAGELEMANKLLKKLDKRNKNDYCLSGFDNSKQFYFLSATVCFELGDVKGATKAAKKYLSVLINHFGKSIDDVIADLRYRPCYLYDIAVAYICMGNLDDAKKYIGQINGCHLCVMCEYNDCFEYYFAKGLIAEIEKSYDEAVKCYKKAIEIKGDYPCAARHLEIVTNK